MLLKEKARVSVRETDIIDGEPDSLASCPLGLALKRTLQDSLPEGTLMYVSPSGIRLEAGEEEQTFNHDKTVASIIRRYDEAMAHMDLTLGRVETDTAAWMLPFTLLLDPEESKTSAQAPLKPADLYRLTPYSKHLNEHGKTNGTATCPECAGKERAKFSHAVAELRAAAERDEEGALAIVEFAEQAERYLLTLYENWAGAGKAQELWHSYNRCAETGEAALSAAWHGGARSRAG